MREKGGGRREEEGENRLLCTCRAPDHIQMPRSWPPWREVKREEKEEERREERREKRGKKREEGKREQERERRELREN